MSPAEEFISELLQPSTTFSTAGMSHGEPGLPTSFFWRKQEVHVVEVLKTWKESGPCTHGSGELYLRKHWYQLLMNDRTVWTVYFERKARSTHDRKRRWWLYTRASDCRGPEPCRSTKRIRGCRGRETPGYHG